jgi:tape measure domain-containing protein
MPGSKAGVEAGRAYVKAYLDDSLVGRGLSRMRSMFAGFATTLAMIGTRLVGVGVAAGGIFAAPLKRAADMQLLQADLEVLAGGAEQAKKVLADLRKFAADTPLEFTDVAEIGRQLLNLKVATPANLVDVMRKIGDASAGIPERMQRVSLALGQMSAKGRIQAEEMMQLTEAGIPAWELLAKVLRTDTAGAMKLVTDKAVDAARALPLLINAMGAAGFGRMEKMSRTLIGQLSKLKDSFWLAVTPIGEALLPYAERFTAVAAGLVDRIGNWIRANAAVSVQVAAVALGVAALGAVFVTASVAIRAAAYVVTGFGFAIRAAVIPVNLAVGAVRLLTVAVSGTLTAAVRVATFAVAAMAGAIRAAAAASLAAAASARATAATFKLVAIASSALYFAIRQTRLSMVMLALSVSGARAATLAAAYAFTQTRLAAMALAAVARLSARAQLVLAAATKTVSIATKVMSITFRAAGAACALFGGLLNLTALAITGVSMATGLLATPLGGIVATIALLAAGINYARGVSIDFGGAIGWLKQQFGPLAEQAKAAFGVVKDALESGHYRRAADVLWAGLMAAWVKGKNLVLSVWDQVTNQISDRWAVLMAELKLALAEMVQELLPIWRSMIDGIAGTVEHIPGIGKLIGKGLRKSDVATAAAAAAAGTAASGARAELETFSSEPSLTDSNEARRKEANRRINRAVARQDEELAANKKLADAIAKAAGENARDKAAADAEAGLGEPGEVGSFSAAAGDDKKKRKTHGVALNAVNAAAEVTTSAGMQAVAAALTYAALPKKITPDGKLIAEKLDGVRGEVAKLSENAVTLVEVA